MYYLQLCDAEAKYLDNITTAKINQGHNLTFDGAINKWLNIFIADSFCNNCCTCQYRLTDCWCSKCLSKNEIVDFLQKLTFSSLFEYIQKWLYDSQKDVNQLL